MLLPAISVVTQDHLLGGAGLTRWQSYELEIASHRMFQTGRISPFYYRGDGDASSSGVLPVYIGLDRLEIKSPLTAVLCPDSVLPQFDMHKRTMIFLRYRRTHRRIVRLSEVVG